MVGRERCSCISLHKYVNKVITDLAITDKTSNDVNAEMFVSTDKEILSGVLGRLLTTVKANLQNNSVHISAKSIGNITLLHLRSNIEYNNVIAGALQEIEPLAERLGGCVSISHNRMYGLTMVFTFINQ